MNEEARQIAEDWFIGHPEDIDMFRDVALDRLLDILAYALSRNAAPKAPDSACVDAIFADFLARVPALMRERVPETPTVDVRSLGARERDMCRRVIAAVLEMVKRRRELTKALSEVKVSTASIARATGMARSTLAPSNSPLLSCLVAFMGDYAARQEGRSKGNDSLEELRRRLDAVNAELRRERELSLMKDSSEVRYRREKAAREKAESDLAAVTEEKGKLADRYLRMKEICRSHGIDIPLEIDEMERLEAAAQAYRVMRKGGGMVS